MAGSHRVKDKIIDRYGGNAGKPGKMRRRLLLLATFICFLFWSGYSYHSRHLSAKDKILSYPLGSGSVSRRYLLFTMPVESGEWPSIFNTKDRLYWAAPKGEARVATQIYTNLPRRIAQIETIPSSQFIMAMATDSTHIMADDFYPKSYLRGTDTTLLLVLGPLDPLETDTVQEHLAKSGLRSYVIKVPADNLETRKFELLGSLFELQKYDEGKAKYYTIIDQDVQIPSLSSFQNLLAQYNSVESHLIVDESFKSGSSYTPITVTAALLTRMFDGDATWNKCVQANTNTQTTAVEKISKCAAIMQGSSESKAKYDGESLIAREVTGSALGLLESGHQPLSLRPINIHGPPSFETDLFQAMIGGQASINASELLGRYSFWEDDEVKWVYTHGCSMAHYPNGVTEKQLRTTEVTWTRGPDETPAHDAPYYRARMTKEKKEEYLLHSLKRHSIRNGNGLLEWHSILYRHSNGSDIQVDWVINQFI